VSIRSSDQVVIESTTNTWHVYDLLEPLVERVVVANPIKVKQIAMARVKTDVRDTLILARLLAANLVPEGQFHCMLTRYITHKQHWQTENPTRPQLLLRSLQSERFLLFACFLLM